MLNSSFSRYLFAYGTLRASSLHPMASIVAKEALPRGKARMRGRLYDTGPYPTAVSSDAADSEAWIVGEVFELPSSGDLLARLDSYEAFDPSAPHASLFVREEREAFWLEKEGAVMCLVYLFRGSVKEFTLIPHGDYVRWRKEEGPTEDDFEEEDSP